MGICIDLLKKKKTKTKYHAKIDIFLIDSEQIKYLEHFKIKIIPGPVKGNKTNDSTAKIGMNFAYIAINVSNFNSKADFRENATSLNIKH
jgi:hypothetical protein